jgi:hypothetical protein
MTTNSSCVTDTSKAYLAGVVNSEAILKTFIAYLFFKGKICQKQCFKIFCNANTTNCVSGVINFEQKKSK